MKMQLMDGTVINTSDYNLKRLFHHIPSADINHESSSVEGRYDELSASKLNNRNIRVEFLYDTFDIYDFYLLREELNAIFMRAEPFYIIFKKEPYKRWLVKTASQFEVPPNPHMQSFVVEFVTLNAYAENVYSTSQYTSKEWDVGLYAWNNQIEWEDDYSYNFTEKTFSLYNGGTVKVDPRSSNLKITIKASGSNLRIRNTTTNEVYEFNSSLSSTDSLVIDGVRTFKNNVSSFRNTNKKLISLNPGMNDFIVEVGTLEYINFDFRFLYK